MKRLVLVVTLLLTAALGQWLEKTIWVPDSMYGISEADVFLHNPANNRMYLGGYNAYRLQILDATTLTKLGYLDIRDVAGMVHCPRLHRIYVLRSEGDQVFVLDDRNDSIVRVIDTVPEPRSIAYNPRLDKVYIGARDEERVYVFHAGPDTLLAVVETGEWVQAIVFDSVANRLFVLDATGDNITVFDGAADTVLARLPAPRGERYDMQLHPGLRKLCCFGQSISPTRNEVWSYDVDELTLLARVAMPEDWVIEFGQLLVNPVSNYLYAGYSAFVAGRCHRDDSEDSVAVVNCANDSLVGFVVLPDELRRFGLDPRDNKVYMCCWETESTAVLARPDSITGWIRFPRPVSGFAWNPTTGMFYCPDEGNVLHLVDPAGDTAVGSISYRHLRPAALTWIPAGNKLYVMTTSGFGCLDRNGTLKVFHDNLGYDYYNGPHGYSAELNRLYLANGDWLYVYDCGSDSVVCRRQLPRAPCYPGVLLPQYHRLYLPTGNDPAVVYDIYRDSAVGVRPGFGQRLYYNPRNNRIYGSVKEGYRIKAINPDNDSIVADLHVPNPIDIVVNTVDNEVYVLGGLSENTIYVIDGTTNTIVRTVAVPEAGARLYWVERWNQLFAVATAATCVYDCPARQVSRTVTLDGGSFPRRSAIWNSRNDKLYIVCENGATVLRVPQDTVVARFGIQMGRCVPTWNAIDNRVYLHDYYHIWVLADDPIGVAETEAEGGPELAFRAVKNPVLGSVRFIVGLASGEAGTLRIFDASGRLVWSSAPTGSQELVWSRTDRQGRRVAAGVYIAKLTCSSRQASARIVLQ